MSGVDRLSWCGVHQLVVVVVVVVESTRIDAGSDDRDDRVSLYTHDHLSRPCIMHAMYTMN